ncbi:MAG: UvrD-helicase domain-containing protein [Actinomycetota bacterium]
MTSDHASPPAGPGLDDAQAAAVTHGGRLLRILAPPGSGKTRVLTRRVAWRVAGGVSPTRTVVVTFTRRAAGELSRRLAALGVQGAAVGTFHGLAMRQLRQRAADHRRPEPKVLTDPMVALDELAPDLDRSVRPAILAEWAWAGARRLHPEEYAPTATEAGRTSPVDPDRIADLLGAYADWKTRRGVLDFDDLLAAWVAALRDDPDFGRAQRWRFREVFVDEFQDVNPGQLAVVETLLDDDTSLTVVGDPDQSIYGWNGAERSVLVDLDARLPELETVELHTTYRCPRPIAEAAAAMLGREVPVAVRGGDEPTIHEFDDDDDERAGVVSILTAARAAGRDHGDLAVLTRTRAHADDLRSACERAGLPVAMLGSDDDGVVIGTFHAAKGLEWPEVVLAGVEDGRVPHRNAGSAEELAEEQRLLYVAMTRAIDRLHLSWTQVRRSASSVVETGPSPFVSGIRSATTPDAPAPWRVELERCRSALHVHHEPSIRRRHTAVLAWRAELAERARCLPELIADDALLRALATDPPADLAELGVRTGWGPASLDRYGPTLARALELPHPDVCSR